MKRRLLAWIMAASMVLGMLPGAAFAAGPSPGPAQQAGRASSLAENTDYTIGEANTITVKTVAGLAGALAGLEGKTYATVKLDSALTLDSSTLPITKPGLTLDLNGKTVTYTKGGAAFENGTQTTIRNGTINAANGCGILNGAGGKLTLSNVTVTAVCPLENRGEATVKGGTTLTSGSAAAILSLGTKLTLDNTADNAKLDISGKTGIHAKAGTVTVKGGENVTITGTGAGTGDYAVGEDTVVSWNGPRADGSAILLVAGSYRAATSMTLELRGGKYTSAGTSAVAIRRTTKDAQTNSAYTVAQSVAVNIYSGTFNKDPKGIKAPSGDANTAVAFAGGAISAQSGAAEWKAGAPVDCTFTLKPANANVEVKDGGGNVVAAKSGSTYQLVPGVTYSYTVSADGYTSQTGQVTSAQTAVNVELTSTTVPVASVTLSETALALVPGGEATLTATVLPDNATDKAVVWTSNDETVATVRTDGVVTAVAAGSATITATAGGVSAECAVTVTEAEIVAAAPVVDDSALQNSGLDETDKQTVLDATEVKSEDLSASAAQTAQVQALAGEAAEIAKDPVKMADAVDKLETALGSTVNAGQVVIVVQPIINIKPSAASRPKEGRIVLNITAMVQLVATTDKDDVKTEGDGKNAVALKAPQEVDMTGRKVTLKIPIPTYFVGEGETAYVTHKNRVKGLRVVSGMINYVNTHGFSPFEITKNDTTKASVEDENFTSLKDAVDYALQNGKNTIDVRAGGGATVTINQAGTYIFTGDGAADVVVTAGSGYTVTKNGATWTVTLNQPSAGGNGDGGGGGGGGGGGDGGGSDASGSTGRPSVTGGMGGTVQASSNGTVTITPSAGYEIASITVNGKAVEIPDDGVLTGMKSSDKVRVTFKRAGGSSFAGFTDVPAGAWYAGAVDYVYRNNLMAGVGGRSFAPNVTLTRGMIVQMLYALEGRPAAKQVSFTDVAAGEWYAGAVGWASANGIVSGLGGGRFGPNDALTREQMALILYGYARNAGYDVSGSADLSGYADLGELSGWAADAMAWAVGAGLLSGRSPTTLAPGGSATRAEVAVIMMNFCEKVAK